MRAPRGQVDHRGDGDRDGREDAHRQDVLRRRDGEGVQRRREVVVQHRGAEQGGGDGRVEPAHQGRADRHAEEQQHVGRGAEPVRPGEQQREQRLPGQADHPARHRPGAPEVGDPADRQLPAPLGGVLVGDDVDVDVAGVPGDGGAHTGPVDVLPGLAAAGAEHHLGGVDTPGEVQQRRRGVVAEDGVETPAEALHQGPLLDQGLWGARAGQAVRAGDVHGQQLTAGAARGDPGRAADQRRALRAAGQTHHDPLAGLPGALYPLLGTVGLQVLVDPVGRPEQRQLAQRGEVARSEVVGERGVDLLRRVHVAVREAAAQRLRRHVDQLDLVGAADHVVGQGLPLADPGDALDHVAE